MATRVFLLSGDEKAVHAITQILDELEISFEHSSDAPFTLKRLGSQRFELLIVDCDNTQTATQVFNSARASALNKAAIAIAIVEGKAGVPNAFRLGASLVLTKPVSLEQVRNTLRTGVGMARKDGPEIKPTSAPLPMPPSPAVPSFSSSPAAHTTPIHPPVAIAPPVIQSAPTVIPVVPTLAAAAATQKAPVPVPESAAKPVSPISDKPASTMPHAPVATPSHSEPHVPAIAPSHAEAAMPGAKPGAPLPLEKTAPAATPSGLSPQATEVSTMLASLLENKPAAPAMAMAQPGKSTAAAAAPALAKETFSSTLTESSKSTDSKPADQKHSESKLLHEHESTPLESLGEEESFEPEDSAQSLRTHAVPAFGGLSKSPFAGIETAKRSYTGLIVAGILVLGAAGFAAAWYLKPEFRKVVLWEYAQAKDKIASLRGHATPAPVPKATAPAPAPAAVTPTPLPVTSQPAVAPAPDTDATSALTTAPASNPPSTNAAPPATQPAANSTAAPTSANAATAPAPAKTSAPETSPAKPDTASPSTAAAAAPPAKPRKEQASAMSGELFEIPEDYADDQVVHRVHPVYPKQARAKKLQGKVVLQAIVDKKGKVNSLQLISGDPILAQAAADAVKQWRYKPYTHNGDPADFQTRVTVDFHP